MDIIGITGAARAGKGTVAAHLVAQGYVERSFGNPIRRFIAEELLGVTVAELDAIKEQPQAKLGGKTPRFAMQTFGTEWGRDTISKTLWVSLCMEKVGIDIAMHRSVVISDVRLDNEAAAIIARGGHVIKIVRPGVRIAESGHKSEQGIDSKFITATIVNYGSVADLLKRVDFATASFKGGNEVFAFYSRSEAMRALDRNCGYWSNEFGWCDVHSATTFSYDEIATVNPPITAEGDVETVSLGYARASAEVAQQHAA